MILACSKIAINCNFTARIISLLYIYPQFTVQILHVMYLHIWRGQTTCTFHGLYNWKSSHRLQLWKRVYMVKCNLFPNTLYIGKPNDKWKTVLVPQSSWLPSQHARPTPTAVSGHILLMINPLKTLHAFHSNKFTLMVTVYEKLTREAFLVEYEVAILNLKAWIINMKCKCYSFSF